MVLAKVSGFADWSFDQHVHRITNLNMLENKRITGSPLLGEFPDARFQATAQDDGIIKRT